MSRDVEPSALADLLADPPWTSVAFVVGEEVDVLPARARIRGGDHAFALVRPSPALDGHEVVLLVDDGPYWFELRGYSVRGVARRMDAPAGEEPGLAWWAIEPRRVLSWDYGSLREERR